MCDPVTLLAAAALGGSSFIKGREARKNSDRAKTAITNQFNLEQQRQKKYRDQSQTSFQTTLDKFQPQNQQETLGDLVAQRQNLIDTNSGESAASQFGAVPEGASKIVKSDIAKRMADAVARGKQQAIALAKISAPSDVFQSNATNLKKGALDIGTINDFSQNSASLNPYEQEYARIKSQKHTGADTFADLLGLAGQGLMVSAAGGSSPSTTAATWQKVGAGDQLPWRRYIAGYDTGAVGGGPF